MRVQVLLQHPATDIPLPANLEVRDDRWDPGAETGLHDHPGPVILAVIEGELTEETPSGPNILRTGQVFRRPAHGMHNVKNIGSTPARVLAIHFDPVQ
jgi:quercetin dioxygenase-like cupin family protein